jgi:photosynthetic reaction center cytochrome c subunit
LRILRNAFLMSLALCGLLACRSLAGPPGQQLEPQTQAKAGSPTPVNPHQEANDRFVQQILEKIAGRENDPTEQVFKNVQSFKGMPAKRLLLIMNRGYSRALGVACTHCHVENDFASDDKHEKRAAREMMTMHRMINEELKKMKNLEDKPEDRAINCSTCHRGAVNPMESDR